MKIGMINDSIMLTSLEYLYSAVERAVEGRHEIVYRPPQYWHSYGSRREKLDDEMIGNCDLLLGWIDDALLEARHRVGKHVPYAWFSLGNMARGFGKLQTNHKYLKTTDVMVGTCTADLEIARKFIGDSRMRILPISFDETSFYPVDEDSRRELKTQMGFRAEDRILLYAGRITLEKNVQAVLKIFSVLQGLVPDLHFAVVGNDVENPFMEFGVFPIKLKNTLFKTMQKLGIAPERVHFYGRKNRAELCHLYNIADVMVNMTLHHDENFGLGQVEAMACGTPVVCTNWGGLKDTVVEGETGYRVSTFATSALGIKADWWSGVCKLVSLLTADEAERRRLRRNSLAHVNEKFSIEPFGRLLDEIITEAAELKDSESEPLAVSDFAREFWRDCPSLGGPYPYYRYSPRSYQLYRELITPYTGAMSDAVALDREVAPGDVLCLATPAVLQEDGSVWVDDLIFPFSLTPPEPHAATTRAVLEAMREEPLIKVEKLLGTYLPESNSALDSLAWMLDAGLILRTQAGCAPPPNLGAQMSTPLYSVQRVTPANDIVLLG